MAKKKTKPIEPDADAEPEEAEPEEVGEEEAEPEDTNADEEDGESGEEEDDEEDANTEPSITVPQTHVAEEMEKWQANQALLERIEESQKRIEHRLSKLTHKPKAKPLPSPANPPKTIKHQTIKARRTLGRLFKSKPQS